MASEGAPPSAAPVNNPLSNIALGLDLLDKTRILQCMLESVVGAHIGGELEQDELEEDELDYAIDRISESARSYMTASVDHLGALMDLLEPQLSSLEAKGGQPFSWRPEEGQIHHVRSLLMLSRAALESAAQSLWLLESDASSSRIQRHLQLVVVDLQEEVSALGDEDRKNDLAAARREHDARYGKTWFGYKAIIREAATLMGEDPASWERMWRGASAATHGRVWVNYSEADLTPSGLLGITAAATNTLCESFRLYMQRAAIPIAYLCMEDILDELLEADPDKWFASIR